MQSSHSALKSPMKQSGFTCGHPSMPSMRAAEFERKKVMLMMNPISYWFQVTSHFCDVAQQEWYPVVEDVHEVVSVANS